MKFTLNTVGVALLAMLSISPLVTAIANDGSSPDPVQLMERVKWRPDGDDRRAVLTMTLTEPDGYVRERKVTMYEKDEGKERKSLIFIQDPPDLRGTGLLIGSYDESAARDDDIWLYLPSMQKTKRIAAGNKRGRFVGSEFSFADMERVHISDYDYRYLGEEAIGDRTCYVVEAKAAGDRTEEKTGYSRRKLWIDKERALILRDEYYDTHGLKLKAFEALKVRQIDGFWTITDGRMDNTQTGRITRLSMQDMKYNVGLDDRLFSTTRLARGDR